MRLIVIRPFIYCCTLILSSFTAPIVEPAPAAIVKPVVENQRPYVEVGVASWYGAHWQGRKTASGQRFDMNKLTAAHPTLPLSTRARVINLANGRSVEVRINDRGPYIGHRAIDLSEEAARKLHMKHEGLALVRIEVLPDETLADSSMPD